MSETTLLMTNQLTLGKANWAMDVAQKKADRALKRAEDATAAAKAARKRAFDETLVPTPQPAAAPTRTSTKAFAAKDPHHAIAVLAHIDLAAMTTHEFSHLQLIVSKYSIRTLSEVLADRSPVYKSVRASAMMATKAVRYVFDVACELAANGPQEHAEAHKALAWASPQSILKGRETRGAGVLAYSAAAVELLKLALTTAKARVQERVDADDKYACAMDATIAASAV